MTDRELLNHPEDPTPEQLWHTAVQVLTDKQWDVWYACDWQGESQRKAAEQLRITVPTLKEHRRKAKSRIVRALQQNPPGAKTATDREAAPTPRPSTPPGRLPTSSTRRSPSRMHPSGDQGKPRRQARRAQAA